MTLRQLNLLGFSGCIAALGFALYLQYVVQLEPCPLCILQRMAMIALGLIFLLAALHHPRTTGQRIYGLFKLLALAGGLAVAGRHVWLQTLPADQVPSCGPGYDYLMENFPLSKALSVIFHGSGECAKIDWTLLGITLPQMTLAAFALLLLWELYLQYKASHVNKS